MTKPLDHRSAIAGALLGALAALPVGFGVSRATAEQHGSKPYPQIWHTFQDLSKDPDELDATLRGVGRDIVAENQSNPRRLALLAQLVVIEPEPVKR